MPRSKNRLHARLQRFVLVLFLFPAVLLGQSNTPGTFKTFDLASDPAFRDYKHLLTDFAHHERPKLRNDFCLFGYVTGDNLKSAWIIWRQRQQILLWEGGPLDSSRRTIHLKSDVVASEDDLHGSTHLVTRAWVQQVQQTCQSAGVEVHVPAARPAEK